MTHTTINPRLPGDSAMPTPGNGGALAAAAAGASGDTPPKAPEASLKRRAVLGSAWTMTGYGFNQALRFASNIVLAWLLAPEVFGLMALVNTFMTALELFSDVGISPSIIHNKRGNEQRYLNTAWTIQVIRGGTLWVVAAAIAWPVSQLWDERLFYLLPVAGAAAAISGFQSTSVATLNRKLHVGPIMIMRVLQAIGGIVVMIGWALAERHLYGEATVWALVAGNIAAALTKVITSHLLSGGTHARFGWDSTAAREMFRFGRWVFLSTIVTFLAAQSDKLIFEPLVGMEMLGLYYMAQVMATLVPQLSRQVAAMVGFPALADLYRRDIPRFHTRLRHLRMVLLGVTELGLLAVVLLGPWFINVVYPDAYRGPLGMDWILVPLAIGAMAGMVNTTYGTAYLAMGRTSYVLATVSVQFLLVLASGLGGFYLSGQSPAGFVIGMALVQWLLYPATILLASRAGIWDWKVDVPILASAGAIGIILIF